jgi:cytoskeleton protein RodZ
MPEIGATLREARMRQRLDVSEVEAATKIRAKYLRALENEEWDLLPGPTYVKTFLRTYAEALGLDARLLVEEYKLRHERLSDIELQPIAPRRVGEARRRRPGPRVPRGALVVAVLAAIVGLLAFIGRDDADQQAATPPPPGETETEGAGDAATTEPAAEEQEQEDAAPARPRPATLRIEPTGPISVCLKAAGQRTLIDDEILTGRTETFRSSRFVLRVGNGEARLRINGRVRRLGNGGDVMGYEITRNRFRRLPERRWPNCA